MQFKFETIFNTSQDLANQFKHWWWPAASTAQELINQIDQLFFASNSDKVKWFNSQNLNSELLDRALGLASANGHLGAVKTLSQIKGVNPAAYDNYAIREAAKNGHVEIVKFFYILEYRNRTAELWAENNSTVMFWAAEKGLLDVVKCLCPLQGIEFNMAIKMAAENGHLEVVKFLCSIDGVNPGAYDNYALNSAAKKGHLDIVKFLCSLESVDPAAENNELIRWAAKRGNLGVVQFLCTLEGKGIDPAVADNAALRNAAEKGHLGVVKFLCSIKAVDPTAWEDWAIKAATQRGHRQVAEYLGNLPCYNPYAPNISLDIKNERMAFLKELKLESCINSHLINSNQNLKFLFFKDPGSSLSNLLAETKTEVVKQAVEFDNFGLIR